MDKVRDVFRRFRSGGRRSVITLRRKYRSRRNVPFSTSAARSRLVAEITRKSERADQRRSYGAEFFLLQHRSSFA